MTQYPAFTIYNPENGDKIEIFADGRVTGLDTPRVIINNIPRLVAEAHEQAAKR